jgi:hypothetical protein
MAAALEKFATTFPAFNTILLTNQTGRPGNLTERRPKRGVAESAITANQTS